MKVFIDMFLNDAPYNGLRSGELEDQMLEVIWLSKLSAIHLCHLNNVWWCRILLKDTRSSNAYIVDPKLNNFVQNLRIHSSIHLKASWNKVRRHHMSFMTINTQYHDILQQILYATLLGLQKGLQIVIYHFLVSFLVLVNGFSYLRETKSRHLLMEI